MSTLRLGLGRVRGSRGFIWVGDLSEFSWDVMRGALSTRMRQFFGESLRQASILIEGSVILIIGMVLAFGLVIGVEASYGARMIGAPSAAGAFTAIANLREIVPYAFGYMLAAKVATGYVAEIGTMRITDEIDAVEVMGLDAKLYLCSTRLLASWIVLPFVFALAMLVAFAGSLIAVVFQIGQSSEGGYLELFWKFQDPIDLLYSAIKSGVMATFVVLVGCYYGFRVYGGPVAVGQACARSMIVNLLGIHAIGILGTQLFWGGVPRLPIGG